jgi:hypothetical protein
MANRGKVIWLGMENQVVWQQSTTTDSPSYPHYTISVYFSDGGTASISKTGGYFVRCVAGP